MAPQCTQEAGNESFDALCLSPITSDDQASLATPSPQTPTVTAAVNHCKLDQLGLSPVTQWAPDTPPAILGAAVKLRLTQEPCSDETEAEPATVMDLPAEDDGC